MGTTIPFFRPTANGAVNAVIAAVRAAGETTIENFAPEPEIHNTVAFLQTIGAQVEWKDTHSLHVHGVDKGTGSGEINIIPDRRTRPALRSRVGPTPAFRPIGDPCFRCS